MNLYKILFFFLLFFNYVLVQSKVKAEELSNTLEKEKNIKVDKNEEEKAIIDYSNDIIIKPFINNNSLMFTIESDKEDSVKLEYSPNVYATYGVSFSYWIFGFSISTKLNKANKDEELYGKTDYFDFLFNYYGSRFGFDFNYTYYTGFYITNSQSLPEGESISPKMIYYNNLSVGALGFNGYFIFSPKKLSLSASFDQTSRQTKSGGSFMLMGSYFQVGLKNNNPVIPVSEQAHYYELGEFDSALSITVSLSPGYGYTFVYKDFYISPVVFLGLGLQGVGFDVLEDKITELTIAVKVNLRLSVGYNGKKFFAGLFFVSDANQTKNTETALNLVYQIVSFNIFGGYRF